MHHRDEMSNAPSRRDVQCTVETRCPMHRRDIKSQWKSREIYLECPNDHCDELDKCNKEIGKTQWVRIIWRPHGRTIWAMHSVNPTPWKKGRTNGRSILQRRLLRRAENPFRIGLSDAKEMKVGQTIGSCTREHVFQAGIFSSGSDDPTLLSWASD